MEKIAAIGGGLFVLASLLVGGRLILLSIKTRGLPEFLLGAGLFLMGGVGYPMMIIAIQATTLSDATRIALLAGQMSTTIVGMSGLAWFTRRVFRPKETWAALLMYAIVAAYLSLAFIQAFGPGIMSYLEAPDTGTWSGTAYLGAIVMTWAGVEAMRYWTMQSRRLALGLADPVVTDRFFLWGFAILSADAITIASAAFMLVGIPIAGTPLGSILVGSLGLVAAGGLWLAFVPPQSYLVHVRERAARLAEEGA